MHATNSRGHTNKHQSERANICSWDGTPLPTPLSPLTPSRKLFPLPPKLENIRGGIIALNRKENFHVVIPRIFLSGFPPNPSSFYPNQFNPVPNSWEDAAKTMSRRGWNLF